MGVGVAAECVGQAGAHDPAMRPANHTDAKRRLLPRDYARDVHYFGEHSDAAFHLPPGGDAASLQIAWVTHQLVVRWRRGGQRPSGQALGQRFGFSRSTWSRIARGTRWPGEAGFVALVYASRVDRVRSRPHDYAPPSSKAS